MTSRRRTFLTTAGLLITGTVLVLVSSGVERFRPEEAARGVVATTQQVFSAIGRGIGNTVRSVGELRRLREDYEGLLEELEQYERLAETVEALERENDRLREQLGFAARTEQPVVAARVIARDAATGFFSSFTINRGERHGLRADQAVIAYIAGEEGLIGRISEVSGGTALVTPVFAPGAYVAARLDRSRHEGLLQGTGQEDDPLVLRYIPRDARNTIRYGDLVVTSGLNSLFPADIPVGRVMRVSAPSWETSLIIDVDPVLDYSRVEYVFVLTGGRR